MRLPPAVWRRPHLPLPDQAAGSRQLSLTLLCWLILITLPQPELGASQLLAHVKGEHYCTGMSDGLHSFRIPEKSAEIFPLCVTLGKAHSSGLFFWLRGFSSPHLHPLIVNPVHHFLTELGVIISLSFIPNLKLSSPGRPAYWQRHFHLTWSDRSFLFKAVFSPQRCEN